MKKKLVSFDIFDTLITRATTSSEDIFLIMQNNLCTNREYFDISELLRNDFAQIRVLTETFMRENLRINQKKKEIKFDDIYDCIQINYNLSDIQLSKLKELEIQTEKNNLYPIKQNIEQLKEYLKHSKVILISDMYFSKDILHDFLTQFDNVFAETEIYVSADYNLKKSDGSIFRYIKKELKPDFWLHIGDNFKSDVFYPCINGINTKQYNLIKLKSYEKQILKDVKDIKIRLAIGCSKILRLQNFDKKYQFGCSFAAPILYDYVKWVLDQCKARSIKHLYFVARDGYILQKIADIIIKNKNLNLITHYFYTSRLACKTIKQNNKENILSTYLNQEISETENSVAFVDINGSGKTQDYITEVLNKNRVCKTYNFYLHNKTTVKQEDQSTKCFMIPMVDTQDWIEYLCRCPQGQTTDYQINADGIIIPVKEQVDDKYLIEWGINTYIDGILDYTEIVIKAEERNNISVSNITRFLTVNTYLHNCLDKETADIIGSIPFATSGKEKFVKEAAPKINLLNLFFPKYTDYISIARCNVFIKPIIYAFRMFINPRTYAFINKEKDLAYIKFFGIRIDIKRFIWRNK